MARNFTGLDRPRAISINIPGYNPEREVGKIAAHFERVRNKQKRKHQEAAQRLRVEAKRQRAIEEQQIEELNMELATRSASCPENSGEVVPCHLFQ